MFSQLEKDQLKKIVNQYTNKLNDLLKDRGLQINLSDQTLNFLVEKGYDKDFGARPMKRVFQRDIQNPLAIEILSGAYPSGSKINIELNNEGGVKFLTGS
jgi:ATP-dependent Clp protease ATP-binding subunit ClpB